MTLHDIFERIRDVIRPPTEEDLLARYAVLVGRAQRWAAQDCRYLTAAEMQKELPGNVKLDLDQMDPDVPVRIELQPIAGGFGAGFFESLLEDDEKMPPHHYLVRKIMMPVSDVGVSLTYPDGVLLTPDCDGNVVLFRITRDYRDFDPDRIERLARQVDEAVEYGDAARREGMGLNQ